MKRSILIFILSALGLFGFGAFYSTIIDPWPEYFSKPTMYILSVVFAFVLALWQYFHVKRYKTPKQRYQDLEESLKKD